MIKYNTIVFIDEDNTGLSPFAAGLFKKKLRETGSTISTYSKGTAVLFPEPVNPRIAELAKARGVFLENHSAAALQEEDYADDTLILTMDSISRNRVYATCAGPANIFMLKEYMGENGELRLPIGEGIEKYEAVCTAIDRLLDGLIQKIKEEDILI
ncbi:MAG: low molecular weight phosphatase family protein [Lachnospiraceae bacterium]|jgi:protein-tyrosine-phosphatase